ncbi:hypothetical protein ABTE20_21245, partial [Acinetobacter baumannii]
MFQIADAARDFDYNQWVKSDVFDSETDGYFLVPNGPLPSGWRSVSHDEAANIWGREDPDKTGPNDQGKT